MLSNLKILAPFGALLLPVATALDLAEQYDRPSTTTTTIPYLGSCDSTITLNPCPGQVTVIIQTPIGVPTCTNAPTTVSMTANPTSSLPTSVPTPGGPCLLVNPLCRPAGLNIDYYANAFYGYSSGNTPSSYYITQRLSPKDSSLTNVTFFPQNTPAEAAGLRRIYPDPAHPNGFYAVGWTRNTNGGVIVDNNNFTLVYEGFYRAPKTGTYNLCSTADNENDVFFGHGNAFSCLNRESSAAAQPLFVTTGGNYLNGLVCRSVHLIKGFYYPIRNVMGNHQGPSAFNFTIQEPGVPFEERTNDFTGHVYPRRCGIFW
ncbi:hypothetical protein C7999DRAFT_41336 [Corynascus novoguineensis]|uniref:PA14 domain-containing protein n=1 Tax=Corynascus novoguineensis TaxID=1126955 RepID=A0AAN7CUZ2_9PEZI|nr:hypothetical protein C7999DRAFT_41336 [Corynascus novoguineensis]